ncbi:MAG TPA: hypothetical protein VIA18_04725, partial [Polyangia bacterium]|nr:hypothetical protein [Polyangia bacterium]
MRRESAGLTLAVVGVVTLIFGLAYLDLRREQVRALDEFTAEQAALSATLAATLSRRLDSVERDLGMLAALDAAAPPALPLLVDGKSAYHEVELLDDAGRP